MTDFDVYEQGYGGIGSCAGGRWGGTGMYESADFHIESGGYGVIVLKTSEYWRLGSGASGPFIVEEIKVMSPRQSENFSLEAVPIAGYDEARVDLIVLPVGIEPDEGMAGVLGDVVRPAKISTPIRHFVTPKKTTELNQPYVVLKAVGVTAAQITEGNANQIVKWSGGEAVPGEPLKRRVQRGSTGNGPTEVKIVAKEEGVILAQMKVWVVWADASVVQNLQNPDFRDDMYSSPNPLDSAFGWRFKFSIKPNELFSQDPAADVPNLGGNANSKPPGYGTRYFFTQHLNLPKEYGDTAPLKWDVSRQVEVKVSNNPLGQQVPLNKFKEQYTFLKAGQPAALATPVPYPSDAAQGNDDPQKINNNPVRDEDSNPYRALSENNALDHVIGEITSYDNPAFTPFVSEPASGSAMALIANFREFARLEIKGAYASPQSSRYWYRISDYINWHHVWAAIYGEQPPDSENFIWFDSGSSSGNNVFITP